MRDDPNLCSCGSGKCKFPTKDGYGIFLGYMCEDCEEERMDGFRNDIMEQYKCDEPLEED